MASIYSGSGSEIGHNRKWSIKNPKPVSFSSVHQRSAYPHLLWSSAAPWCLHPKLLHSWNVCCTFQKWRKTKVVFSFGLLCKALPIDVFVDHCFIGVPHHDTSCSCSESLNTNRRKTPTIIVRWRAWTLNSETEVNIIVCFWTVCQKRNNVGKTKNLNVSDFSVNWPLNGLWPVGENVNQ